MCCIMYRLAYKSSLKFFSTAKLEIEIIVLGAKARERAGARPSRWSLVPEPETRSEGL